MTTSRKPDPASINKLTESLLPTEQKASESLNTLNKTTLDTTSNTEMNIILYASTGHWCTHIAATFRDINTNESYFINYGQMPEKLEDQQKKLAELKDDSLHTCSCCCNGCGQSAVTLYSDKKLDDFIAAFTDKFPENRYDFCTNNCADAVDFALNYLFSDSRAAKYTKASYSCYQLLCCSGFITTLGLINCFPAPPYCITLPKDVFNKAKLLSYIYDKPQQKITLFNNSNGLPVVEPNKAKSIALTGV